MTFGVCCKVLHPFYAPEENQLSLATANAVLQRAEHQWEHGLWAWSLDTVWPGFRSQLYHLQAP